MNIRYCLYYEEYICIYVMKNSVTSEDQGLPENVQ